MTHKVILPGYKLEVQSGIFGNDQNYAKEPVGARRPDVPGAAQ